MGSDLPFHASLNKKKPYINFPHQKEPIYTKTICFRGRNQSQRRLCIYHRMATTFSLISQIKDKKNKKMKFVIKIKFHKLLRPIKSYNLKS